MSTHTHTHGGCGRCGLQPGFAARLFTPDKACVLHGPPLSSSHRNNQEVHRPHRTLQRVIPSSSLPAALGPGRLQESHVISQLRVAKMLRDSANNPRGWGKQTPRLQAGSQR